MDDDQQFCLRWNNHQSTLISVFDTLLENGTLVDCTLAAEGKFLKAHKVVLSACSPYFATLLAQQYDKHPIFILKDVKFQELRAMMDYMYRGEVNISQDQLAALLKAAESLQIKGLSDNRGATQQQPPSAPSAATKQQGSNKAGAGLTIEHKRTAGDASQQSREGSSSPSGRKRKKVRRRTVEQSGAGDAADSASAISATNQQAASAGSSSSNTSSAAAATGSAAAASVATGAAAAAAAASAQPQITSANTSNTIATASSAATNTASSSSAAAAVTGAVSSSPAVAMNVTKKTEAVDSKAKLQQQQQQHDDDEDDDDDDEDDEDMDQDHMEPRAQRAKHHHHQQHQDNSAAADDMLLEPKSEYDNDETVEDLTLDDEELLEDLDQAGPSHGGEGSSQGYAQWQVDRQDEVFMGGQEGSGQHRDAQDIDLSACVTREFIIGPETRIMRRRATTTTVASSNSAATAASASNSKVVVTSNVLHRPPSVAPVAQPVSTASYAVVATNPSNSVVSLNIQPPQQQQQQHQQLQLTPQSQPQSFQIIFAPSPASNDPATTSGTIKQEMQLQGQQIEWITAPAMKKYTATSGSGGGNGGGAAPPLKKLHELHSSEPTTLEAPQAYPVILSAVKHVQPPPEPQSICVLKSASAVHQQHQHDGQATSALLSTLSPSLKIVKHMTTTKGSTISLPITLPMGTTFGNSTTITLPMSTTITQKRVSAGGMQQTEKMRVPQQQQQQQLQQLQQQQQQPQQQHQQQSLTIDNVRSLKFAEMDDIELPDGTKIGYATVDNDHDDNNGDEDEEDSGQQQQQQQQHTLTELKVEGGETTLAQKYSIIAASAVASTDGAEPMQEVIVTAAGTASSSTGTAVIIEAGGMDVAALSGGEEGSGGASGGHSYACRHCGKRYRWKSTLRRHENDECGGKEPAHQCPYCSYKAKQRGNLGVHVRKHHGDQPQLESRRKKRSLEATLELAEELMSA